MLLRVPGVTSILLVFNGNIKKEPLLALVLCAGGRMQVANGDGQAGLFGQVLQLLPTAELLDTHRRGVINFE